MWRRWPEKRSRRRFYSTGAAKLLLHRLLDRRRQGLVGPSGSLGFYGIVAGAARDHLLLRAQYPVGTLAVETEQLNAS